MLASDDVEEAQISDARIRLCSECAGEVFIKQSVIKHIEADLQNRALAIPVNVGLWLGHCVDRSATSVKKSHSWLRPCPKHSAYGPKFYQPIPEPGSPGLLCCPR